jgi:hypothetical protein
MDSTLTLSVWAPTPEELAIGRALHDQLASAVTIEEVNEAHTRIAEHWSEMQRRHRDDPPLPVADPAAVEAANERLIDLLREQLHELGEDPQWPPDYPPDGLESSD